MVSLFLWDFMLFFVSCIYISTVFNTKSTITCKVFWTVLYIFIMFQLLVLHDSISGVKRHTKPICALSSFVVTECCSHLLHVISVSFSLGVLLSLFDLFLFETILQLSQSSSSDSLLYFLIICNLYSQLFYILLQLLDFFFTFFI